MKSPSGLEGFSPPNAFIQNVPPDIFLVDKSYYYFEVSNAGWKDGKWQRMRIKPPRARRIAKQVGYGVRYALEQLDS